jgi:hypothetical protein
LVEVNLNIPPFTCRETGKGLFDFDDAHLVQKGLYFFGASPTK